MAPHCRVRSLVYFQNRKRIVPAKGARWLNINFLPPWLRCDLLIGNVLDTLANVRWSREMNFCGNYLGPAAAPEGSELTWLYQRTNVVLPLANFEFETVTIDVYGAIIARARHTARQFREDLGNGVSLEMVEVPGGVFLMGSRTGIGYADERPQHSVKVNRFFLGKYPVTQEQWQAIMRRLPDCRSRGARRPVDRVSWNAASDFCRRLSKKTGRAYRLPGEAEWEYACRARTTTPFYCGETLTTDLANYVGEHTYRSEPKGIYRHATTDVGSFPPNAFGLYDMHGNIWEWCADAWHDDYVGAPPDGSTWQKGQSSTRVLRGGSWHEPPDLCRCATRLKQAAGEAEDLFGFRVACTLDHD